MIHEAAYRKPDLRRTRSRPRFLVMLSVAPPSCLPLLFSRVLKNVKKKSPRFDSVNMFVAFLVIRVAAGWNKISTEAERRSFRLRSST